MISSKGFDMPHFDPVGGAQGFFVHFDFFTPTIRRRGRFPVITSMRYYLKRERRIQIHNFCGG